MRSFCPATLPLSRSVAFGLLSAALASAAFVGCGRSNPDSSGNGTTPPATGAASGAAGTNSNSGGDFKIALVMSGATTSAWDGGALNAFKQVQKELNVSDDNAKSIENAKSPGDQEKNLRAFASQGYNIVFGNGNEYEKIADKMQSDYPKTLFVIPSGDKIGPNMTPIKLQLEDGAYLEGMLAASMTKTGKLAFVGAEPIPPLQSVASAFEAGAKSVRPDVTVNKVFTNSWDDSAKAKDATVPLLNGGADVIIQDLDNAAQGVFNAVQEAAKSGKTVYALGTNSDQNSAAPDVILASAPINIEKAFVPIAKAVKDGTFKPTATPYDMKSGVIGFVLNPALQSKIPADALKKIQDTQGQITGGQLAVMSKIQKGG